MSSNYHRTLLKGGGLLYGEAGLSHEVSASVAGMSRGKNETLFVELGKIAEKRRESRIVCNSEKGRAKEKQNKGEGTTGKVGEELKQILQGIVGVLKALSRGLNSKKPGRKRERWEQDGGEDKY